MDVDAFKFKSGPRAKANLPTRNAQVSGLGKLLLLITVTNRDMLSVPARRRLLQTVMLLGKRLLRLPSRKTRKKGRYANDF
jgi:hypothetical protein